MFYNTSQCLDSDLALSRLSICPHRPSALNVAIPEYTALVVDDDPDISPLVNMALRPFRIQTDAVEGGKDAFVRLRERRYDLLILDLAMNDVHGFDVLRALRELPLNKDLPVLILTANGSREALARSFGHGADELVKKPFDLSELGMRAFRLIRPFGR